MDRATLLRMLDVNARANLLLAQSFLPRLKARSRGGLLLVASIEAFVGTPFSACYSASKAFALSLGKALWGELLGTGVDVLVLVPGATDTPLLASRDLEGLNVRAMKPAEVAEVGLSRLRDGPYVVPGTVNRWTHRVLRRLPRGWLIRRMAPVLSAIVERSAKQA